MNELTVGGDKGLGFGFDDEARGGVEADGEMLVPDPLFFDAQIAYRVASDPYRKTAGNPYGARHFSRENFELDHQNIFRFTTIVSPG